MDEWFEKATEQPAKQNKPLEPSACNAFALLVGLVGRQDAEIFWMKATRIDYDLEPVTRYCLKNDQTIKDPRRVISAAIRDKANYTQACKRQEKSLIRKGNDKYCKYEPGDEKDTRKVNLLEAINARKWAVKVGINTENINIFDLIERHKKSGVTT